MNTTSDYFLREKLGTVLATPAQKTVSWSFGIGFILALMVLVYLGLSSESMPAPAGADAPENRFSSARALTHLGQIAAKPHPTGTPENAEVRKYLVDELAKLGMNPEVQSGLGRQESRPWGVVGRVHNVVGRLAGSGPEPRRAMLLSAHYDSVPNSPGAADNGASVAAILEALRALKTGAQPYNDVIVLFSDGEEAGLLGSQLFATEHPAAADVALALNFEYRGSSGPMLMFETSGGNGKMVAALARSRAKPVANSLLYEIYQLMPNDTDMTSFKDANMPGMNFAAIEKPASYHMQLDRIEALNPASLQQEGELVLGLTRHFGSASLAKLPSRDSVYFNRPGGKLVHYPAPLAMLLAVFCLVLFGVLMVKSKRAGLARRGRVLVAAFVFLVNIVLLGLACQLLWMTVGLLHPEYNLQDAPYNSMTYLFAITAAVPALYAVLQSGWGRWLTAFELALGALMFWAVLQLLLAVAMPGATFLFAWSLLPLLVVQLVLVSASGRAMSMPKRAGLLLLGLAPAVLLFAPMVRMLFNGLGPHLFIATGLILALLMGLMGPLLDMLNQRRLVLIVAATLGFGGLVAGSLSSDFDADKPRPSNLFYAFNASTGKAFWISRDDELDDWNRKYFASTDVPRKVPELFGPSPRLYWAASAPLMAGLEAPELEIVSDTVSGPTREVVMRARTRRNAPALTVKVENAPVLSSEVQGKVYTKEARERWVMEAYGMADEWLDVRFKVKAGMPFQVRLSDEAYGLPPADASSRTAAIVPGMYGTSGDTVRAVQVREFK
jgi:hypothetical protein